MRGDSNNVAKVKQMFSDWSKHNARFVGIIFCVPCVENCFLDACVTITLDVGNLHSAYTDCTTHTHT